MTSPLKVLVAFASDGWEKDPFVLRWGSLRSGVTTALRGKIEVRFAPTTANRILSAVRGVLKECWRTGKISRKSVLRLSFCRYLLPRGKSR